ncbi:MAG: hypothetical protein QXT73_00400 [Candidatus Methanomethylicaceae archaeon]
MNRLKLRKRKSAVSPEEMSWYCPHLRLRASYPMCEIFKSRKKPSESRNENDLVMPSCCENCSLFT